MPANGPVPAPAPRGRGAVANVASETAALVKPDALPSDFVEHTLQGLAAHHSPAAWMPADGEVSQVLEYFGRGLLDELASQEPTTQFLKDLKDQPIEITSVFVPQLEEVHPRVCNLLNRQGVQDSAGNLPSSLNYRGLETWTTYVTPSNKPCVQEPERERGAKGRHFEVKALKGVNFGTGFVFTIGEYMVHIESHKKRPPEHASPPGVTPVRQAGKMATYFGFGAPPDRDGNFTAETEYFIDIPKESAMHTWNVSGSWHEIAERLWTAGGDDDAGGIGINESEAMEAHEFKIIDGKTYLVQKRGKETVNVLCASFTISQVSQILAFNDRSRPPHYKVVCVLSLNPNAAIPYALLKLGEDMATIAESRYQKIGIEVDLVLRNLTTQASANAALGAAHPKLVWHNKNADGLISLVMQKEHPPTTIAASVIGRQPHDPTLFQFANTAIRIDPVSGNFIFQDPKDTGIEFIPTVFTQPDAAFGVPLTTGLLPQVCCLSMEFDWLAYFISWTLYNRVDPTVFGENAMKFQFAWCHGVFVSQHVQALQDGRASSKAKGSAFLYVHSSMPYTAKTALSERICATFGIFDKASGEIAGNGAAMKRIVSYFADMPVAFDDIVLGEGGTHAAQKMAFVLSQLGRYFYDGPVRIVCGSAVRARSMPIFGSNDKIVHDVPLATRCIMLEAGPANSPGEINDLNFWQKIASVPLPIMLNLCDPNGLPHKNAVIDIRRAFSKAIGKDMRQLEPWACTAAFAINWNLLMQRGFEYNIELLEWAVQELAHICHAEKTNCILDRFILEINRIQTSKGWDQANPDAAVGIHNLLFDTSPNPMAHGEQARAWVAVNVNQIFSVFARYHVSIDNNSLFRFVREVARAAGTAMLCIKGHTLGNGTLAYFYSFELQSSGEQNPWPPVKLVSENVQVEEAIMQGNRAIRVPLTWQEAYDGGLCSQYSTLFIKRSHWDKVLSDCKNGFNDTVSLRGVTITSSLLGGRQNVNFIDMLVNPSGASPLYDMAVKSPFASYCGIKGFMDLGNWRDLSSTPDVVDGAHEANMAFNGLSINEQFSAGELTKIITTDKWTPEYISELPPCIKACPFPVEVMEGCELPEYFKQFGRNDTDEEGQWSSGQGAEFAAGANMGSNLGADNASSDSRIDLTVGTPSHLARFPASVPPLELRQADAVPLLLMQEMQDLLEGDADDPLFNDLAAVLAIRNVRQRTGTAPDSGPNSDEEAIENEMLFGAPLGPAPPSAPPSPPNSPEYEPVTPPGTPPPLEGEPQLPLPMSGDAAEQLHKSLYEEGLFEVCERCGNNPEECGGYEFCSNYSCKNTDEMGFYCERMAEPGSDRCASCAAGGKAYFTDPIAPGAMWSWELSDEEEADKVGNNYNEFLNTELADAMRLQKEMRHSLQGVHFAPPTLKNTIGGFSALGGRSFSFPPPKNPPAIDFTKGGSHPSSPLHNLQEATKFALWGKSPDSAQEFKLASSEAEALKRAAILANEVNTLPLNYAPGVEPRVSLISKYDGKRKMKHAGSIYLRTADNNSGSRSPYAQSVEDYEAAAAAMRVLEPIMQEVAMRLGNWVPDQEEVAAILNAQGETFQPASVQRENGLRALNTAQALRNLSVVDMVEGRSLNYLSDTFRKDAAEMRSLPVATEIYEVPTTAITVVEGDPNCIGGQDNLGFKKIRIAETDYEFIPHHDPINPQNSDVQVGTPFSYEDATDKFNFNTHDWEVKPPEDEITSIMGIYDKFRKGEAEPEQVEKMLEGFHSLCSRPHRAMTWQKEYHTVRDQVINLCRVNEKKDKEIKRLRNEKNALEEECRKLKRQNTCLQPSGPEMIGSHIPEEEDEWQPGMLRASPTPSQMLFRRTPSPDRPARDPRSRSPPPIWSSPAWRV